MSERHFKYQNIVILCEGTKTEFQYFCSIKNYLNKTNPGRFSEIKVVPVEGEMVIPPGQRKRRTLKALRGNLDLSICYYCLQEENSELYDKYKAIPTRFVRETKLYMDRYKYQTGWVVYDHDNHQDRQFAAELAAEWGVKVAFSSRCFEEWLLMHFERNDTIFQASVCKDADGNDRMCGTGVDEDCHGTVCIGGLLREKKYIPDYQKSDASLLFENYTLPKLDQCLINVEWLNQLEPDIPYFNRSRYTSVGDLVKYLLDVDKMVRWVHLGSTISFRGTQLVINQHANYFVLENIGKQACIVKGLLLYYNKTFDSLGGVTNESFLPPKQSIVLLTRPQDAVFICLHDGNRQIIIELDV